MDISNNTNERPVSKAFEAYKAFKDEVYREGARKNAEGKYIITVGNLKPVLDKDNNATTDQSFFVNSRSNEAVVITLTRNGVMKHAAYIDFDKEKGKQRTFLGKDFRALEGIVKDPLLALAAAKLSWEKVQVPPRDLEDASKEGGNGFENLMNEPEEQAEVPYDDIER